MSRLAEALSQLIAVTRPRPDQSAAAISAMAERFAAVFREYPEAIVLGALNAWPKHSEWFPTEKELRDLLDYLKISSDKVGNTIDTQGRSDKPSGMTKHFYEAAARIKGEAYARSWLRGGVTCMFTDRYVYVNQVGHDRLWRDLSNLIRECGVAIVVDDEIAGLLQDYIERNGIGGYETKRRRA